MHAWCCGPEDRRRLVSSQWQSGITLLTKCCHVKAMIASSVRAFCRGSAANVMGQAGIWNSVAAIVAVCVAR